MKKVTCADLGGPSSCTHEITAETKEEMMDKGGAHVMGMGDDEHKKVAEQMKNAGEQDVEEWKKNVLDPKWEAAEEA